MPGGYCDYLESFRYWLMIKGLGKDKMIDTMIALYEKDAESLNKNLIEYYNNLYIKDTSQNLYNNETEALTKIDDARRYLKSINSVMDMFLKQKQDIEKYMIKINEGKDLEAMDILEGNSILAGIVKEELRMNVRVGDDDAKKRVTVARLKEEMAKINKIIQSIKDLESELERDSKKLILDAMIIGKKARNKKTLVQCINNDSKTKGKERVRL